MAMVDIDNSKDRRTLTAQVRWLGLRVGSRLALLFIHQVNRVNSRMTCVIMTAP